MGVSGRFIPLVERLISFKRSGAFDTTLDAAEGLVGALRSLVGGSLHIMAGGKAPR